LFAIYNAGFWLLSYIKCFVLGCLLYIRYFALVVCFCTELIKDIMVYWCCILMLNLKVGATSFVF